MAGHNSSKRNRRGRAIQTSRRRQVVGLSSGAAALLAFGLSPLAGAPVAKADVFDDILDLAVGSAVSSAVTAVNPTDFLDPGVLSGLLGDLTTPAGWDTLATDFSSIASSSTGISDTGTAAAAATDPSSSLEALEQGWIDSSSGQEIDASLNSLFHELDPTSDACGYICNGVDGTGGSSLAAATGQDGGVWFGDGGNGVTDLDGEGGAGGDASSLGNGGDGGNGVDGEVGGAGGTGGLFAGDGGNGGTGGDGVVGVNGGDGGSGGAGGNGGLLGIGGTGGAGGSAVDGTAGSAGSAPSGATGGAGGAGGDVGTSPGGGGGLTVTATDVVSSGQIAVSTTGPEAGDVYTYDWPGDGGVSGTGPGELFVYNPATSSLVATINVGLNPDGVAVSSTGPEVGDIYVTNEDSGTVSVISPGTNTVVDTINVGKDPIGVAVSPTGANAGDIYVLDQADSPDATVQVISPSTNTVVDSINLGLISPGVDAIAVSPTGADAGDVYVDAYPGDTDDDGLLWVVNLPDNTVGTISTIPAGIDGFTSSLGGLGVSPAGPDAGDIYLTDPSANTIAVLNPTATAISYPISLGAVDVAFSPTGTVYASDTFLDVIK
jgi:YVTN family beta-propeller protein